VGKIHKEIRTIDFSMQTRNRLVDFLKGIDKEFGRFEANDTGNSLDLWVCQLETLEWVRLTTPIDIPVGYSDQNRALVYDPRDKQMFLVLGAHGDEGEARLFALRFRHEAVK
jgi:hypothetical protein